MNEAVSGRQKLIIWLVAALCFVFLIGANAHLVYVATVTQPDCVAHTRTGGGAAAKSSCSP